MTDWGVVSVFALDVWLQGGCGSGGASCHKQVAGRSGAAVPQPSSGNVIRCCVGIHVVAYSWFSAALPPLMRFKVCALFCAVVDPLFQWSPPRDGQGSDHFSLDSRMHAAIGLPFCLRRCSARPACAQRKSGLYRFMICAAAAQNALYGSTLSPPRLQQVREAAFQYMNSTTLEQDSLFQLLCPEILAQLKTGAGIPGKAEEVYKSMREHRILYSKGEKVFQLSLFYLRRHPCLRSARPPHGHLFSMHPRPP